MPGTLSPLVGRRRVPVHAGTDLFKCQREGPARTEMSLATRSNQFRICTLGSIVVAIDLLKRALCNYFLIRIRSVENVFTCRDADVSTAVSVELSSGRDVIYRSLLPV